MFLPSVGNNCFNRRYLIVFTKYHSVALQTFVKRSFYFFPNFFTVTNFDYVEFWKILLLVLRSRFEEKFLCFLWLLQFKSGFFVKYKFFIHKLFPYAKPYLWKNFQELEKIFLLSAAWQSSVLKKTSSKLVRISSVRFLKPLTKSASNKSLSKFL